MKIPAHLMIGARRYTVEQPKVMYRYGHKGECDYKQRTLTISTHSSRTGERFDEDDRHETFWHEVTHAILFDMKSPLYQNERFVTAFSRRLSKAIKTAKFKSEETADV